MKHIANALVHLSLNAEPGEVVTLVVHLVKGYGWLAAICPYGTRVPLLDKDANYSLAARGNSPMEAITALNDKLPGLL